MIKNKKSNEKQSSPVPSGQSILFNFTKVKQQVKYKDFARAHPKEEPYECYIDPLYKEICLIIAEMYVKPPDSIVRIRGSVMEAGIVQEVYRELTHAHIELVAENFKQQRTLIRKKAAYLQTSLYNALFELDSHYTNLVNYDMHNYGGGME